MRRHCSTHKYCIEQKRHFRMFLVQHTYRFMLGVVFFLFFFWIAIAPLNRQHCTAVRSTAHSRIYCRCFLLKLNVCCAFQWNFLSKTFICFGAHSSSMFGHCYLFLAFSGVCECIKCYHIHKYIPACTASLLFSTLSGYKFGLGLNFLLLVLLYATHRSCFWTFISIFALDTTFRFGL